MGKQLRNEDKDKKKYENSKVKDLAVHAEKFLYYEEVILGKSYNTVRSYRRDIYQFIDYLDEYEEITKFDEVETITVRSFIAYLNSGDKSRQASTESNGEKKEKPVNPVSKRSINRKISALRTFFKYLQEKQVVKVNKISLNLTVLIIFFRSSACILLSLFFLKNHLFKFAIIVCLKFSIAPITIF